LCYTGVNAIRPVILLLPTTFFHLPLTTTVNPFNFSRAAFAAYLYNINLNLASAK